MKRTFLNAEDAYKSIEEALNFLESIGEEPLRGFHSTSYWGNSGMNGESGTVLRDRDTNVWKYEPRETT